jgi:hypothetical protein
MIASIIRPHLSPLLEGDRGRNGLAVADDGDFDDVADFVAAKAPEKS